MVVLSVFLEYLTKINFVDQQSFSTKNITSLTNKIWLDVILNYEKVNYETQFAKK